MSEVKSEYQGALTDMSEILKLSDEPVLELTCILNSCKHFNRVDKIRFTRSSCNNICCFSPIV